MRGPRSDRVLRWSIRSGLPRGLYLDRTSALSRWAPMIESIGFMPSRNPNVMISYLLANAIDQWSARREGSTATCPKRVIAANQGSDFTRCRRLMAGIESPYGRPEELQDALNGRRQCL